MKLVMVPVLVLCGLGCGGSGATSHVDSGGPGTGGLTAGTGGTAGARATGGAGGMGTDAAAGVDAAACHARDASPDGPGAAVGQFTLVYDGTVTSCVATCETCTGFYSVDGYVTLDFIMENSAGAPDRTEIQLGILPGVQGAAYSMGLEVLEDNPPLGPRYQGVFSGLTNIAPGSCITYSRFDLVNGGGIAGSIDCDLMGKGAINDGIVHVSGTFSALFLD